MCQGDSNVDLEQVMQRPWAVFIRKLTLESGRKSSERQGKLPGAVDRVNGDTWLMRHCLHHSWVFLSGTLLFLYRNSQRHRSCPVGAQTPQNVEFTGSYEKNRLCFSNLLHLPPPFGPFLLCNLTPKHHPPPLLQHVSKRHCSNNR